MADERTLPGTRVPAAGYDLIERFASSKRMSRGQAIRYLLKTAPELREFAEKDDLSVEFDLGDWGGYRRDKGDEKLTEKE